MSHTTVKAHERGLKNTLLWEGIIPVSSEDCYAYGQHLEDLCQEKEAATWHEKAAEMGHASAMFQLLLLMQNGWYRGNFFHGKNLDELEQKAINVKEDLEETHTRESQDVVWELWRQFNGRFSDFPHQRDYTEAWSFRLGRYLRAAETAPCKEYYLRLSRFYEQGFPEDSEENRSKMQRFAKEYAEQAEHME